MTGLKMFPLESISMGFFYRLLWKFWRAFIRYLKLAAAVLQEHASEFATTLSGILTLDFFPGKKQTRKSVFKILTAVDFVYSCKSWIRCDCPKEYFAGLNKTLIETKATVAWKTLGAVSWNEILFRPGLNIDRRKKCSVALLSAIYSLDD
jgi:hypothetical protein